MCLGWVEECWRERELQPRPRPPPWWKFKCGSTVLGWPGCPGFLPVQGRGRPQVLVGANEQNRALSAPAA